VKEYRNFGLKAYKNKKLQMQQYPAVVKFIPSKVEFDIRKNIEEYIPIKLMNFAANLPIIGSEKLKEKAAQF